MRGTRPVGRALVHGLVVILLAGCNYAGITPVTSTSRKPASASRATVHTVHRGDTLYSIAWRHGIDYRRLAGWNAIRQPYTIYPGQKLRLRQPPATQTAQRPSSSQSHSARAPGVSSSAGSKTSKKPAGKTSTSKKTATTGSSKKSKSGAAKGGSASVKRWQWPAKGKVVTSFSRSGRKGIDIAGKFGQSIVAASGGRIVYSGSGLIGYGQLIIVKHNKRYLSAYAHNNKILVKEGDTVTGGQRIAEMGRNGSNRAMLHFEIRRDGKPIDPVRYLPK